MRGIPQTILVAPDSFKGTFRSVQVAEAIGRGLEREGRPVDLCPVADGGEGTLESLQRAWSGELRAASASDPLGREIEASFVLSQDSRGLDIAIVETAAAIGLGLLTDDERDPIAATTTGAGELVVAAVQSGAKLVYIGVGGSATTDGGAGAIRAIRRAGGLRGARLVVLTDVRTPFEQAARVFGPQKGADREGVRRLSARLQSLARRLERDPRGVPMTGAAGGLSGGLWASFDAQLVAGAAFVLDAVDFDRRVHIARAVVTGEGTLDQQSLAGKAVSEVATRARQNGVPAHAIVGKRELDPFGARVLDLQAILEGCTLSQIENAAGELAKLL